MRRASGGRPPGSCTRSLRSESSNSDMAPSIEGTVSDVIKQPHYFPELRRHLEGQHVRVRGGHWVVARLAFADLDHLNVHMEGDSSRRLSIEMPRQFDSRRSEDMAWLLGCIESQLL